MRWYMTLDRIRIVLVNTTHPGNIGGAARAMANMGVNHLYLVGPQRFPSIEATVRAAGADHLLERAIVCESLDDAVADCGLVIGTTARQRSVGWVELSPEAVMAKVRERILTDQIAFVFGREASGLTNSELERCQYHVRIPVEEGFPSINLAAAVMIIVYELKKTFELHTHEPELASDQEQLATSSEVQGFYRHLEDILIETGFLKTPSQKLLRKVKRIFSRTPLREDEVNILRGILTSIQCFRRKD